MNSELPEDDDRTVIRPSAARAAPPPVPAAAAVAPAVAQAAPAAPVFAAPPPPVAAPSAPAAHADSGANTLPPGTMIAEFEVTEVLGEGGFGIVYLALDRSLDRRVALKEYMPSALSARGAGMTVTVKSARHRDTFEAGMKSFINEAKLLAQFDHPSLVKVYRFWEANGTAYMVMPFYEGITLKDKLRELGNPPDEAFLMGLLDPLTEALAVIHAEQCFHRDIAPDNVMLLKDSERPLLLDFGAARRVIGDMTQALTVILKAGYAPVEQYAEVPGMKQGPWTDVYALAAVVYYAIHGKTPPPSVGRLVNDSYVPLAQSAAGRYSERFLAAIDRALTVKPEERTQSVGELRHDLGLEETGPVAKRAKRRGAVKAAAGGGTSKSRMPLILGGAVVGLAALGGGLYLLLAPSAPEAPAASAAAPAPAPAGATTTTAATTPAATPATADPGAQQPAAAPAVAAAPVAAAAPAAYDPVRELDRIVAAQTPGYGVEARPAKASFRIGKDKLAFSIKSAREGHVYVLLHSADGNFMKLFPNSIAPDNRIRAGQTLNLPQASWPMEISGPAGTDHYTVIVSAHPRSFGDTGMVVDSGFGEFPRVSGEAAIARYTGSGSVFAGKPECAPGCKDEYGAASFTVSTVD